MDNQGLKMAVATSAIDFVLPKLTSDAILGVGTGSTANCFIDLLGAEKERFAGAVASSEATAERLRAQGIRLFDLNEVDHIPFYVDGADEIDASLRMIKGGGGALTREKIVAAAADCFVCIADASKKVEQLGQYPLPIEVIPMARALVTRQLDLLGGVAQLREGFVTDNGNEILDVTGLDMTSPEAVEAMINQFAGVVCSGLFAIQPAGVLFLGAEEGVQQFTSSKWGATL